MDASMELMDDSLAASLSSLLRVAILRRRKPVNSPELAGEIERILVAELGGNFLDRRRGGVEELGPVLHFQSNVEIEDRISHLALECGPEVRLREVGHLRQFRDG